MKEYQIFIQNKLYKNLQSDNVSSVIGQITLDIANNKVPDFDHTKPANIKIVPLS